MNAPGSPSVRGLLAAHLAPLASGREAAASAPAQVRVGNHLHNLFAVHVEQRRLECAVAADAEIFFN